MATTEKVLISRVIQKHATLAEWQASDLVLKNGEIAIATVPQNSVDSGLMPPAVGIKVGDGTHVFSELNWIQATAGDVHAWAKAASKPTYNATEISAEVETSDGKTVASRLSALEAAVADDLVYRILTGTGADANKWFLQSKKASEADAAYTTVSTIDLSTILAGKQDVLVFDGTYNETTNKVATVSTVTNAINALDVDNNTSGDGTHITGFGAGKTLATLTQTDGKIGATFQNIEITLSQVSDAGDAAAKDVITAINNDSEDPGYNGDSTDLPTTAAVVDYVDAKTAGMRGAMHWKGTVSSIPPASGTYESGDVVALSGTQKEYIFDGTNWEEFGDQGSYALKTITVTGSNGLTGGGTLEANRVISHAEKPATTTTPTSTVGSSESGVFTKQVKLDAYGHVIDVVTGDETTYQFATGDNNGQIKVTPYNGATAGTPTNVSVAGLDNAAYKDVSTAIPATGTADDAKLPTVAAVKGHVTSAVEALDSSVAATAADGNQYSVLTGVTQADGVLTAKTEVKLSAIAKTGNVNDLIQTSGDVLVIDCGGAT